MALGGHFHMTIKWFDRGNLKIEHWHTNDFALVGQHLGYYWDPFHIEIRQVERCLFSEKFQEIVPL